MKKIFALLVLVTLFASCKLSFEAPKVKQAEDFKITKMDPKGLEGEIVINISNPNPIGFNIYKSYFDVTYGGSNLGRAWLKKKIRVPAKSDKNHTFYLKGSLEGMGVTELTKLLSGKGGQLEINGKLKVGKWFYKKKFDISHKQRMSISK